MTLTRRFAISLVWASLTHAAWPVAPSSPTQSVAAQSAPARSGSALQTLKDVPAVRVDAASAPSIEEAPDVMALCESARSLIEDGRLEPAAAKLNQALAIAKSDYYEPRYLMGLVHFRDGRVDEARVFAESALRIRPDSADARCLMGRILERVSGAAEAIPHYRAATLAADRQKNKPSVTLAWYLLADCLRRDGRLLAAAQALERFDEAIWEVNPEHRGTPEIDEILKRYPLGGFDLRVELLRELQRWDDLLSTTERVLERRPDDLRVGFEHVRALRESGRGREAYEFALGRMSEPAGRSALLGELIESAAAAGTLPDWLAQMKPRASSPADRPFVMQALRVLLATGRPGPALELGLALRAAGDSGGELSWDIAAAQLDGGDLSAAIETLATLIRALPGDRELPPRRVAAWIRQVRGRELPPAEIARLAADTEADVAKRLATAMTALGAGQAEAADALLTAVLAEKAGSTPAVSLRGQMLLARYDWPAAKTLAEKLIQESPGLAAAHGLLARALDGLDERAAAVEAFRRAIKLAPGESVYLSGLAQHSFRTGQYLPAQRYFSQALEIDSSDPEAQEGLIDAYTRDDKWDLAREQFARMRTAGMDPDVARRVGLVLKHGQELFGQEGAADLAAQARQHPTDARIGLLHALSLLTRDRADDAAAVLAAVLQRQPDDYHAITLLARVESRRLDFERSIALLGGLAARYPNRSEVLELQSEMLLRDFRVPEGRAVLQRLIDLHADRKDAADAYRLALARAYFVFADIDEGVALMDSLIEKAQQPHELALQKVQFLLESDQAGRAYDIALKMLEDRPEDSAARDLFLLVAERSGNLDAAVTRLVEWADDTNPIVRVAATDRLIRLLAMRGDAERAYKVARDYSADTHEQSFQRRRWLIWCHAADRKPELASEEATALMKEGQFAARRNAIWETLILALAQTGQPEAALERCEKLLAEVGENPPQARLEVLNLKRQVLAQSGNEEQYAAVLELLHNANPTFEGWNNDLGYTWVDLGIHMDRAVPMIRHAVSLDPLNAAYLDSYGWAFYKSGDFEPAARQLGRCIRLAQGSDPVLFDHLADAQWRLGQTDQSRANWEKALALAAAEKRFPPERDRTRLIKSIREKLDAVSKGEKPRVAATAAEKRSASQPK